MSSAGESLSADRLRDVKDAINDFLSQSNVYESLRDIIDTYVTEKEMVSPGSPCDAEDVMTIMRERGVVHQLMAQLRECTPLSTSKGGGLSEARRVLTPAFVEGESYLHVRLLGGRAFLDSMDLSPSNTRPLRLFAGIHFGSQRGESVHVPLTTDPKFEDDFVFHVDPALFGYTPDNLIEVAVPLVVAVFRDDMRENVADLVGENIIDWRRVLKTGALKLTVELSGCSTSVPVGIIDLELQLLPHCSVHHSEEEIASHMDHERAVTTTADREFLLYARRWWAEYQNIRPSHRGRKVKLFTALSNGRMVPVTHFVSPIQAEYGIESPFDAARFVSLLKSTQQSMGGLSLLSEASMSGGGGGCEQWLSLFAFVSQRQGHPCNHATLLCSLLLGFGLDAYCCIGALEEADDKTGVCVITRVKERSGAYTVTVWNPTTGARTPVSGAHPFVTADCMFNHRSFFANIQVANRILTTSFDVNNEEFWKPIVNLKLRNLPRFPVAPLLSTPPLTHTDERSLEMGVRARIESYRDGIGLQTQYNDDISYTLAQALQTYEQQRVAGDGNTGFSMFESCVKGILGGGKTFKAIPVNVSHTNDLEIMNTIRGSTAGREIIDTVADSVHFGVRIKIYSFPEHVLSVWVMLAVAYHSTPIVSS